MALLFNADTEMVDFGSATSLDDMSPVTVMFVSRLTEVNSSRHSVFSKSGGFYLRENNGVSSPTNWFFFRQYSTTAMEAASNDDPITINVWHIVFAVDGGAGVAPRLYAADLGSPLAEVSYGTQNSPAGSLSSDASSNLFVGRHQASQDDRSWVGDIACFSLMEEVLTLEQCKNVYDRVSRSVAHSSRCFSILGYADAGSSQPDWSGNGNNGTVTGATVSDNPPLAFPFGFIESAHPIPVSGRVMSSLVGSGGLAGGGGIAGAGGGLAS